MRSKINGLLLIIAVMLGQSVFAQIRTVTGTVSDQSGIPLPGVTVLIKGTSKGTQTDFDGNYQIETNQGATLVFSYVSMKTQELLVNSNTINVSMLEDVTELKGLVITSLGIKREKKALGYATTTIGSEQITNVVNNNPFETLSGKVAGVDISAPTQPGSSTKVIIRGITSITGSNDPLYIVDGTPLLNRSSSGTNTTRSYDSGSGINDLDPNNIESITVLRGAAATALYGSRAGNGVFIITTKKGKKDSKINVDFMASSDISEVARVPHLQTSFGQGWNGLGYSNTANGVGASNENGSWGPAFNGEIRPWGTIINNSQQIKPYVALDDNMRDFFTKGLTTTQNLNINGGNEKSDFSLNFTNLNSDGVVPTTADKYLKRTISFNGGLNGEKFNIRASLNYSNKDQNAVNTGQGDEAGQGATLMQELLQIPVDISIVDLQDYTNNPFNTPSNYFTPYASNPYWTINENATNVKGHNFYGNTNLTYNITPKLFATWQIGGNYQVENLKSHGAIVNYLDGSAQDLAGTQEIVGGVTEGKIQRTQFDTFLNLNYNFDLTDDLDLNLLAGINYNQRESNSLFATITNLDIPNYYELSNSAARPTLTQNDMLRRTLGVYSQAEFGFMSRYYLTLSARNDISSTLPVKNNSYFYPAASLSAVVLQNNTSFLKVRGAISQIANDTDPYLTESSLIPGNANAFFGNLTAPLGGVNFYELGPVLGNEELKPERTTEIEFGIEGDFFSKRLSFDASLYHKTTDDLIINIPLDPSTGYGSFTGNFGAVVNKGIELAASFVPVSNDNFTWTINYTFTKNLNEVTELAEGFDKVNIIGAYGINFAAVEGKPIGSYYGEKPKMNDAGQYIVNPDTGYYETEADQYLGNGQRDFVMGLQNSFKYKNVSLNFAFDWKQGGEIYSYTKRLSHFVGNGIETTYNDRAPFIIPNSVVEILDTNNEVIGYEENTTPVSFEDITNFYNTQQNPGIENTHLIDKTFLRLRDLNLTYSFPLNMISRLGLTKLSIGAYGKNLFMWTPGNNPYVDPEVSTFGNGLLSEFGEFGSNPSQRVFGGFLKLSF